jgi:hypothetical protein
MDAGLNILDMLGIISGFGVFAHSKRRWPRVLFPMAWLADGMREDRSQWLQMEKEKCYYATIAAPVS